MNSLHSYLARKRSGDNLLTRWTTKHTQEAAEENGKEEDKK